jgi:hypothetical protein
MESFSEGSLSFVPDTKATLEEPLLEFISKETGKMKSLARSDMDSFLQFGLELINISKPFHLEGIGTIQKNTKNQLEFLQSSENIPQDPFGRPSSSTVSKRKKSAAPSPDTVKKIGLASLILLMILAAGLVIRWFINRPVTPDTSNAGIQVTTPVPDTNKKEISAKPGGPSSSEKFGVVLEQSGRQRAFKRFADLKEWGHNVRMVTKDSVTYKLYILINAPLSDTAKHRDSLRLFFNRRVWIETLPNETP